MVRSNKLFSIQGYCDKYLGFCPTIKGKENELRNILDHSGRFDVWDYPLVEIDHIVENHLDVVLVDCTYIDDKGEQVSEYRWFEIPKED